MALAPLLLPSVAYPSQLLSRMQALEGYDAARSVTRGVVSEGEARSRVTLAYSSGGSLEANASLRPAIVSPAADLRGTAWARALDASVERRAGGLDPACTSATEGPGEG